MTAIWALSAQIIMITLGYLAACTAGGLVATVAIMNVGPEPRPEELHEFVRSTVFSAALTFTALQATFFPSAVAIAITEGLKLRKMVTYLGIGCVVGLLAALPIRAVVFGADIPPVDGRVIQLTVASAAVGAFFYWLVAGRTAGRWMEMRWFERNRR